MSSNNWAGFSVEELRGCAKRIDREIATLRTESREDADKLAALEAILDQRDELASAIEAALSAGGDPDEAETDTADADTDDDDSEGDDSADDSEDDATTDPEAAVDEAVAAAAIGGGDRPRHVSVKEPSRSRSDMKKFLTRLDGSNRMVEHREQHSWSTMQRETNHVVRAGSDATEAIRHAVRDRAAGSDKTAAGCFCGPDDAINSIKASGETVRPFSDTLPTITASGDVKHVREIDLADALTGVTEWSCADQDGVDPETVSTWKPCFELECATEQTSAMYAVSACASFNTQQLIGNPTLIDNLEHVMQVAFNKTAELSVYNAVRALASQYTFGYALTGYGASAQLLAAVGWATELIAASLREGDPSYTLALPAGLVERVLTDGVIRGTDDYRTRDDLYERLATLGIANVVELVDEGGPTPHDPPVAPGGPAVAAPTHPNDQRILLYRPEDLILGVGPDIDLGITRSPELARQNKLQWFTEGFEFVEKVGTAPIIDLEVPFCASGIRPAFGEGEDCTVAP